MSRAIYTFWADCPKHGTEQYPSMGNFNDNKAYCYKQGCKDFTATARVIKLTKNHPTQKEVCDSRCLNGSKSCACICMGSCHGMGNCNPELHPSKD